MKKLSSILFIIAVLVTITLPATKIDRFSVKSESENRTLARFEPLFVGGKLNGKFGKNFELYLNDRFFLRYTFLRIYQKISPFFSYSNGNVLIGKSGWSFIKKNNSMKNFSNTQLFSVDEKASILEYLKGLHNWCYRNNKKFYFIICPDKHRIYGDFYPDTIKKVNPDSVSKMADLVSYIRENSEINMIYPVDELLLEKGKGSGLLYWKNDTHWNFYGGYIGYKSLANMMDADLGRKEYVFSSWNEVTNAKGDLNKLCPEYVHEDYDTVYFSPDNCFHFKNFEWDWDEGMYVAKDFKDFSSSNREFTYYPDSRTENDFAFGKAVVYRDSYFVSMKPYFAENFRDVTYFWRQDVRKSDVECLKNSDIVVYEVVERYVPSMVGLRFPKELEEY